jgi:hypothetical protein
LHLNNSKRLLHSLSKQYREQCQHAITSAYTNRLNDDSLLGEKDMWQLVHRLCPKHVSDAVFSVMQHPSGHMASTPAEKADAFQCHYERIGSHAAFASSNPQFDAAHMSQVTANVQQYLHDSANSPVTPLDLPIAADEFLTACRGCALAKQATRLRRALSTSCLIMEAAQPQIRYYSTAT